MATQKDVRRLAMSLPEVVEEDDRFAFSVRAGAKRKGIAWVWLERIHLKKARVPQPKVIAVRVPNLAEKEMLLKSDEVKFFTEPHYNGYPAILVRLAEIEVDELEELIIEAWRCQAPNKLVKRYDEDVAP
jgi:hypothetical protein